MLEDRTLLTGVDLVAFAQGLTASGTQFFGAAWCPQCTAQKQLFEDGSQFLPFIEVTNPDRSLNQTGIDENITVFPTWEFPDGSRETGLQTLETLSTRSGVAIPMSGIPSIAPLADVALLSGSPLHVAFDGYDPSGTDLTFAVTSTSADIVPTLLTGNRSLRISLAGYGDMIFQLFEQRAPRATQRIIELAESGFYDNVIEIDGSNSSILHRVIDNFILQGGDPVGDPPGTGGSALPDFDDQFNVDLQHNTTGLLSMAKSVDDSNNSQFFITEGLPRHLDFNHTVFGLLTVGDDVREAMSEVPTDATDRPLIDLVIESVEVIDDPNNGVFMLSMAEGLSGQADITVTATDPDGNMTQETFHVTATPDPENTNPFLADIPEITTVVDTPITFQLTGIDVEGDPSVFIDEDLLDSFGLFVPARSHADLNYSIDGNTGLVTVTPTNGLTGTHNITVAVAVFQTNIDYQVVPIHIRSQAMPFVVSPADHPTVSHANDGSPDDIEIRRNGDILEVLVNGDLAHRAHNGAVSEIFVNGSGDDDNLTIDLTGINPIPAAGLTYAGGGQTQSGGDSLEINGGTATTVTHTFTNANDGAVDFDGSTINYTGLEPIFDNMNAANRVFVFGATGDTVTLDDGPLASDGMSRISSAGTSETVEFVNPTVSLTISTGAGNDVLTALGIDSLYAGTLIVNGDDGDDNISIAAIATVSTLSGGAGDDTIRSGTADDVVEGDDGNDLLLDGGGGDTLRGGNGNDVMYGGSGRDMLDGGAGNDFASGQGSSFDTIIAGTGDDTLDGGAGTDVLIASGDVDLFLTDTSLIGLDNDLVFGLELALLTGGAGDNILDASGFSGNTTLTGAAGNDVLLGGGGVDLINGDAGDDTLGGGAGNDVLNGGADTDVVSDVGDVNFTLTDVLLTGLGSDTLSSIEGGQLSGGAGNNTLDATAFSGSVALRGEGGDDALMAGTGAATLAGGPGNDTLTGGPAGDMLAGDEDDDNLEGGMGNDLLMGGDGNDALADIGGDDTLTGALGDDTLDGGNGSDVWIEQGDVDLTLTDTQLTGLGNDTHQNLEIVQLAGGAGDNTLDATAFSSDVMLSGGAGNDVLLGGTANDQLLGEDGDDTLGGGLGDDQLDGGIGTDLVAETGDVDFLLTDTQLMGLGIDSLSLLEGAQLTGGASSNNLDASAFTFSATLLGAGGNDLLSGGLAGDVLDGGDGDDMVFGGLGNDFVTGGLGTDALDGGDNNDTVVETGDVDFVLTDAQLTGMGLDTLTSVEMGLLTGGASANTIDSTAFTGSVSLFGAAGNDTLNSGAANDLLSGDDDDDALNAGAGDDLLSGGGGNDFLADPAGADTLQGGDGNDVMLGGSGRDLIDGGAGDDFGDGQGSSFDTLIGGPGNDTLRGGAGTDVVQEVGDVDFVLTDVQLTGLGIDVLDSLEVSVLTGGDSANLIDASAFSGHTTLTGGGGDDVLTGGPKLDLLNGGGGADTLIGNGGNDIVFGGSGRDVLDGGDGDDALYGQGSSFDTLIGGNGDDFLNGGSGVDVVGASGDLDFTLTNTQLIGLGTDTLVSIERAQITGGVSDNVLDASQFSGSTTIDGSAGDDLIFGGSDFDLLIDASGADTIFGGDGRDFVYAGSGRDYIDGGAGDDVLVGQGSSFDTLIGGPGNDLLSGGAGTDILIVDGDVDMILTDTQMTGGLGTDMIFGLEIAILTGGAGDNLIDVSGFSGTTTINADAGNDTLTGGANNDSIIAGDGDDVVNGGAGNDTLIGGIGNDVIHGGEGNDLATGDDGDDIIGGDAGNDTLDGGLGNDTLNGGIGDDSLVGSSGNDGLSGLAGNDFANGGGGNDTVIGGDNNDILFGGGGQDIVLGGDGDDYVDGQGGSVDTLGGGMGTDIVVGSVSEIDEGFTFFDAWVDGV